MFEYDSDGNLTKQTAPIGTTTFTWSSDNRLMSISGPGISWQNVYDALRNRTRVSDNGIVKDYVIDLFGRGDVVAQYEHGTMILLSAYTHGNGLILREDDTGIRVFYTFDPLGSTVEIAHQNGDILNMYAYLPFGEQSYVSEMVANDVGFIGESGVWSEVSGLDYMRARYFDKAAGRFISQDPLGFPYSPKNRYHYTANMPTLATDPYGLDMEFEPGEWAHTHCEGGHA